MVEQVPTSTIESESARPDLPVKRPEPRERIDPSALRAWRVSAGISSGIFLLIAGGLSMLFWQVEFSRWLIAAPLVFALVNALFSVWIIPSVRWRRWRYEVSEREVDLQYGVIIVTRTLIPMSRVQHVDTQQGPILRYFGLASVMIATAAGAHEIPALRMEVADNLRDRISEWAGVAEDV